MENTPQTQEELDAWAQKRIAEYPNLRGQIEEVLSSEYCPPESIALGIRLVIEKATVPLEERYMDRGEAGEVFEVLVDSSCGGVPHETDPYYLGRAIARLMPNNGLEYKDNLRGILRGLGFPEEQIENIIALHPDKDEDEGILKN